MSSYLEQNPNDVNGGQVQLPVGQNGFVSDNGFELVAALYILNQIADDLL